MNDGNQKPKCKNRKKFDPYAAIPHQLDRLFFSHPVTLAKIPLSTPTE
jgi:hypothetical protein